MPIIDYTFTIGNILEILAIIGGGIGFLIRVNGKMTGITNEVSDLKEDISEIKKDIVKLGDVMVKLAVSDERANATDRRMESLENDYRELRKGNGWIQRPARPGLAGEY